MKADHVCLLLYTFQGMWTVTCPMINCSQLMRHGGLLHYSIAYKTLKYQNDSYRYSALKLCSWPWVWILGAFTQDQLFFKGNSYRPSNPVLRASWEVVKVAQVEEVGSSQARAAIVANVRWHRAGMASLITAGLWGLFPTLDYNWGLCMLPLWPHGRKYLPQSIRQTEHSSLSEGSWVYGISESQTIHTPIHYHLLEICYAFTF